MLLELPSTFKKPEPDYAEPEIELACDWIESSALFSGEDVTSPTVVDLLLEAQWFNDQPDARTFVDAVWSRMRSRRTARGGTGPFAFSYQTISLSVNSWENVPAHSYCLLLSYARHHRQWAPSPQPDYLIQGEIFESITYSAMTQLFPKWTVFRTGWSTTKTTQLSQVVNDIASHLCGNVGNLKRWNTRHAKEQGLDVLCYLRFPDDRGNFPAFFVQCASGTKFKNKLSDPDLEVWNDLVTLVPASLPRKGFVTPFTFPQREFQQNAIRCKGLLLDGCRLLSAQAIKDDWVDAKLASQIRRWARPIVKKLPWSE